MSIALYIIAGWIAFSSLVIVSSVGKPRKPVTGGTAALVVALCAIEVAILVIAAAKLGH